MIPIFVIVFFLDGILPFAYGIAGLLFALAACTDFVDGHIARSRGLVTNLGKFLDPIADKVLVSTAMLLILTMKESVFNHLGEWVYIVTAVCICLIMARELIISAFRQIAASNGVIMAADKLGKLKTIFQDIAIFGILFFAGIASLFETWMIWHTYLLAFALVIFGIATILTIWSGIAYVVNNKQVLKDA
jgi:CDP-diacylglycerol--glycerol-3-phosphate 3-phosphatidyltransferase